MERQLIHCNALLAAKEKELKKLTAALIDYEYRLRELQKNLTAANEWITILEDSEQFNEEVACGTQILGVGGTNLHWIADVCLEVIRTAKASGMLQRG